MSVFSIASCTSAVSRFKSWFVDRDFIFHDGRDLRRFSIPARAQALTAAVAGITLCFSAYGVAQAAEGAVTLSGVAGTPLSPEAKVAAMQAKIASMQADVAAIKDTAAKHAALVERRQAMIAAVIDGKRAPTAVAIEMPEIDRHAASVSAPVVAPLQRVERHQVALAAQARLIAERRYVQTASNLRRMGLQPARFTANMPAMGGPFLAADSAEAAADLRADQQFRSLFMTWKKLDSLQQGVISIPSVQPVAHLAFTSNFGIRADPFRGTAAMHAGVDIPGPIGTPVYATADGVVDRAERAGGYGNMIEIDHGKGIQTRYGHLSKILIAPYARVKRGQLIALIGSTGRSTGPHLHYEVRIDGHAVNPVPFLQNADYLLAAKDPMVQSIPVVAPGTDVSDD